METTEPQSATVVHARIKEIFDAFVSHGAPGAESAARVVFDLAGDGGGRFVLTLASAGVSWGPGDAQAEGDVMVKLTAADFVAVADGAFDGRLAVASERIELSGDRALAERMLELVQPPEPK